MIQNNASSRVCAQCGTELSPLAVISLCPRCVLADAVRQVGEEAQVPLSNWDDTRPTLPEFLPEVELGQRVGRYKLLEKVGEGGYGSVYVAEQLEPIHRRVAIKFIKLGMDTKAVVGRFEAERQALALMDHPNIAKVLDAGATDKGRPYFVMELVRGIKITDYCDQAKVNTQERLRLFIQVCQAIQHAHQKGIIHRDIKPSNILVTLHDGVPVPKVIDFGIAKATEGRLTDKTVYTQLHQFIGTPAYMSPEQAEFSGLDIDTRSDIYSLGVLLYELLTGQPPFDPKELLAAGLEMIRRTIREKEPVRPSSRLATLPGEELTTAAKRRSVAVPGLIHQIQGDLDWIVMKCLEKDRNRRYETANGLGQDLQRHLENEPVTARPPSAAYRVQKFIRRNKAIVSAGMAVTGVLVLGLLMSTWQAVRATRAERTQSYLRVAAELAQKGESQQRQVAEAASAAEKQQRQVAEAARAAEKQERLDAQRNAYSAQIYAAYHSLEENNLLRATELLDKQRPKPNDQDLRGWEWRHLWQQCQPNEFTTISDAGGTSVAFSPDGKFLVYRSTNPGRMVVREANSNQVVTNLPYVAWTLSFSPHTGLLAVGAGANVTIWNTETWQMVQTLSGVTYPAKFSPDSRWLVTWGTNQFQLWDTQTWRIKSVCPGEIQERMLAKNRVAFSPNSQLLVTPFYTSRLNRDSFRLWKVPGLEPVQGVEETTEKLIAAAFSANGKNLLVGTFNGTLQVWDVDQGKLVRSEKAHTSFISDIAVAPDNRLFVTASNDSTLDLWDAATYKPLACLRGELGVIWTMDLSPDLKTIATAGFYGTKLWKVGYKQSVDLMTNSFTIEGFFPTSETLVAMVEDGLQLWNITNHSINTIPITGMAFDGPYSWSRNVALKRQAAGAAVGKTNGFIEIWDLNTRALPVPWQAHSNRIYSVAFGAKDTQVATGSESGEVKVWNTATHQLIGEFKPYLYRINSVAFSPDGRMLAASGALTNFVWIKNLTEKGDPKWWRVRGWNVTSMVFSPNGELLAANVFDERAIYLWEVQTGILRAQLRGNEYAYDLGFTPDGKTLAVGANDGFVTLWHIDTQQQLLRIPVDGWFNKLCFSPDGNTLAVGSAKDNIAQIRLWRAPSLKEIETQEAAKAVGK